MKRVLEAKEVEDGRKKVLSLSQGEVPYDGHISPERLLSDYFFEMYVVNDEKPTLFEIREDDSPTAAKIGDGPIEKKRLERLLIVTSDGGKQRGFVAIPVVEERQVQRLENSFANIGEGQRFFRCSR